MRTRDSLLRELRECFARQCAAHGLDASDPPIRGVINNVLMVMLDEWTQAQEEVEQLRKLGTVRAACAVLYSGSTGNGCTCAACAFGGKAGA